MTSPSVSYGSLDLTASIFLLIFTVVYFTAFRAYARIELPKKDRALLASCTMSLSHGVPAAAVAAYQIFQAWPINVDSLNTDANRMLLQYTQAYMVADTAFYLVPYTPTDFLFCTHHAVVIVYVVTAIVHGRGGVSCIFMLLFGECTSLWQNSWYICTALKGRRKWLDSYRGVLSTLYPASYIIVRSVVGPPSVIWLCYQLQSSVKISVLYKNIWIAICLVSLAGSQLWSLSLARTWWSGERKPKELADKLN